MTQVTSERRLAILYILTAICGAIVSITLAIAWGHWRLTLDQCTYTNCSCILYGQHTVQQYLGGSQLPCIWVTFAPILYTLFGISMASYHGYRVLFNSTSKRTKHSVMSKRTDTLDGGKADETIEVHAIEVSDTYPLSVLYWRVLTAVCGLCAVYAFSCFVIYIDGYYKTCNQYRLQLERLLPLHGTAIPVIHGRLGCQAIFDFMDYLEVNDGRINDHGGPIRDGFINTGADLIFGIVAACLSWVFLVAEAYINFKRSKNPQN